MNALWWWIDRWRKSTAYTDMTLEQQGAYRNLLDEAALRGGPIPNDERILAKASGDARRWKRVRAAVMTRFTLVEDGWRNETLDQVIARSKQISDERSEAGKSGNAARWHRKHIANTIAKPIANGIANPIAPDPYLSKKNPPSPLSAKGGSRLTRRELTEAQDIRSRAHGGCPHDPRCASFDGCVRLLAAERKAQAS